MPLWALCCVTNVPPVTINKLLTESFDHANAGIPSWDEHVLVVIRSLTETYTEPSLPNRIEDQPFGAPFAAQSPTEVAHSLRSMVQATSSDIEVELFVMLDAGAETKGVVRLVQASYPLTSDEDDADGYVHDEGADLVVESVLVDFKSVESYLLALSVEKPSMDELQGVARKTSHGVLTF